MMRQGSIGTSLIGTLALALGVVLAMPSALTAQTGQPSSGTPKRPKLSPADSAACAQLVGYVFQNPEVLQKGQQFQGLAKARLLVEQPDSVRSGIAAAIKKGEGDTLKAMAHRALDPKAPPMLDEFIDYVIAFPDSIRGAIATLVTNGKSMTCS